MKNQIKIYVKKPIQIKAVQFDGSAESLSAIKSFGGNSILSRGKQLVVKSIEGLMRVNKGDYVIKGIEGEFYPCKESIFKETYKEV